MTIYAIKDAIMSFKQLYIDSTEVEILFLDELTETIEVRYIGTDIVTFITKSSLSEHKRKTKAVIFDDMLILRYRDTQGVLIDDL